MSERPPFFKRKYIVNKELQFHISIVMIMEILLMAIVMSTIIVCLNNYYQEIFQYIAGTTELQTPLREINKPIWLFMLGSVSFSVFVFALVGIFLSHKIAGPLYRMKRIMIDIGKGKLPREIRFRKGDHMHDMADALNEMVLGLQNRDKTTLEAINKIERIVNELAKALADSNQTKKRDESIQQHLGELNRLIETEKIKHPEIA
ncbi:MAG: methyl-accepting chemotaxis protein [Candidatus Auribacterota bacterium]|nr:methyl-accepting chemotaxis protein [Candidatus Auribacterota bacterium]